MNRGFFLAPALEVAPRLLGARLSVHDPLTGTVTVRITEVEAYHGVGVAGPYDAGSHSRKSLTPRNAAMFGPPGHAYVYLSYGMHFALNLVCSPEGSASGVLLRAGEVIAGHELALQRRAASRRPTAASLRGRDLARGPGNLAAALGITRPLHNGRDLFAQPFSLELPPATTVIVPISHGPRVGVSGEAGGPAFPWRFWLTGDATVSAYRPGKNVPSGDATGT